MLFITILLYFRLVLVKQFPVDVVTINTSVFVLLRVQLHDELFLSFPINIHLLLIHSLLRIFVIDFLHARPHL